MSELFQSSKTSIVEHIKHIYEEELTVESTCRSFRQITLLYYLKQLKMSFLYFNCLDDVFIWSSCSEIPNNLTKRPTSCYLLHFLEMRVFSREKSLIL